MAKRMNEAVEIDLKTNNNFRDWVAKKQNTGEIKRKGERTRDRIWLATADLLNEVGYHELKVSEICEKAGITPPVLYLYFESKHSLTKEILSAFLEEFISRVEAAPASNAYQSIYHANLRWINLARENTGLMRCLLQFSQDEPEFAQLFADVSNNWYLRIAKSITKRFPSAHSEQIQLNMIIYLLGGMMDDLTRKLFADKDPNFIILTEKIAKDNEDLASFVSVIWYRALYGCDPNEGDVDKITPILRSAIKNESK